MRFFDQAKIYIRSGAGGAGCVSFRREKRVPRGGPDGGDGGCGGDVWAEAAGDLSTLADFLYRRHYRAGDGKAGAGARRNGKAGKDKSLRVPVGARIIDDDTGELVTDFSRPGARTCLARGGKGGRGNARFVSSTSQAPRFSTLAEPGQERWLRLELALVADIGLIGMPNAGKSTMLSRISSARPKIGDYPFTTLWPTLGVVERGYDRNPFVVVDLPGLIEGAACGAGLGHRFLRHLSRAAVLAHLVDGTAPDGPEHWRMIRAELAAYDETLMERPEILALTKIDALDENICAQRRKALEQVSGRHVHLVSAMGASRDLSGWLDALEAACAQQKTGNDGEQRKSWTP